MNVYKMGILDFDNNRENIWTPPEITNELIESCWTGIEHNTHKNIERNYLVIFRSTPYIDTIYVEFNDSISDSPTYIKRFTFHDDYIWSYEDEKEFEDKCLRNLCCEYTYSAISEIYNYYSEHYPDWKLKRCYAKGIRLLDHIYNCMKQGTVKEMLYKAGLDELAVNIQDIDEINLLSRKPSELYDGVSIRTLRALNCKYGSILLSTASNRAFIKELQMKYPDVFEHKLNDVQCQYLSYLIDEKMTVGEVGRLFNTYSDNLAKYWCPSQFFSYIEMEKNIEKASKELSELKKIDPVYKKYIGKTKFAPVCGDKKFLSLTRYLIHGRKGYDAAIRRSNRKRNDEWQERNNGYVVRYPQTINDFCREAIYMGNCMLTYIDAYIHNDTTILFLRKTDAVNEPFITMEVYKNELQQAYHRFNKECTPEEISWICNYCYRHGISCTYFLPGD